MTPFELQLREACVPSGIVGLCESRSFNASILKITCVKLIGKWSYTKPFKLVDAFDGDALLCVKYRSLRVSNLQYRDYYMVTDGEIAIGVELFCYPYDWVMGGDYWDHPWYRCSPGKVEIAKFLQNEHI